MPGYLDKLKAARRQALDVTHVDPSEPPPPARASAPSVVERLLARRSQSASALPVPRERIGLIAGHKRAPMTPQLHKGLPDDWDWGWGPPPRAATPVAEWGEALRAAAPEPDSFAWLLAVAPRSIDEQIAELRGGSALAVSNSSELRRIVALPRRPCPPSAPDQTLKYRRSGGTMQLRPLQSAALVEAAGCDGAFAPLRVGRGKTLVALLLPAAMRSKRAVILLPSSTRKSFAKLVAEYDRHFVLPLEVTTIVTYEELSSKRTADVLERLNPDLIVADEAHKIARPSARTRRFRRYLKDHPECRFVPMTGTPTGRTILDYADLVEQALKAGSPLPRGYHELRDWAGAIDVGGGVAPGALRVFCEPGESVREGFSRRLLETPGVIGDPDDQLDVELYLGQLDLDIPERVIRLLREVRQEWSLEGDVHDSPLTHARALRQLAGGFYYRWAWPDGVVDWEWLQARSDWNRAVSERLKLNIRGQDSVALCARAADSGKWPCEAWAPWKEQKHKKPPPVETVWIDDFLVADAVARAREHAGTIIWYPHRALGVRLGQLGIPVYGSGMDATDAREPVIACSIGSQGTGKNLQHHYHRNIYAGLPDDSKQMQQSIGRTHREGQLKPAVWVAWYGHTEEVRAQMERLKTDSQYRLETFREPQKVLYAKEWIPDGAPARRAGLSLVK